MGAGGAGELAGGPLTPDAASSFSSWLTAGLIGAGLAVVLIAVVAERRRRAFLARKWQGET